MKNVILLSLILFINCNNKHQGKQSSSIEIDNDESVRDSSQLRSSFKVVAHLIYDDGTVSNFDVLNDKKIALWNTIIGSGDALKPSNRTVVNVIGNIETLNIKIRNGRQLVVDTVLINSSKDLSYIIKNTGCNEVYINISKNNKIIYNDTIPFHCGE
jgi:hypothetical protein